MLFRNALRKRDETFDTCARFVNNTGNYLTIKRGKRFSLIVESFESLIIYQAGRYIIRRTVSL